MLLKKIQNSKIIFAFSLLVVAAAIISAFFVRIPKDTSLDKLNAFAKCLTEKGAVMYGAYWCPHCQNQKKMFGDAVKFIRYVECTKEPKLCTKNNIQAFPTWILPGDIRLVGTQELETLAKFSGCTFSNE